MEQTIRVNLLGAYYTMRAAAPHLSHDRGYFLAISSLAAAIHLPLLGAYCASKAGVEALGNSFRIEMSPTGARVGVAYFAEIDTEMTSRGFGTEAAQRLTSNAKPLFQVAPLGLAIRELEKGIAERARRIVAPPRSRSALPLRMAAQPIADRISRRGLREALEIARREKAPLTTEQPGESP